MARNEPAQAGLATDYGRASPPRLVTPDAFARYLAVRRSPPKPPDASPEPPRFFTVVWGLPGVGGVTETYNRKDRASMAAFQSTADLAYPILSMIGHDTPVLKD